jgi:hypothetical protein
MPHVLRTLQGTKIEALGVVEVKGLPKKAQFDIVELG